MSLRRCTQRDSLVYPPRAVFVKAFPLHPDGNVGLDRNPKRKAPQSGAFLFGAVGGIRTLGRLLAVTRFPVVLVMTTSIPLRISMLNSKHHYTKIGCEVNTQFSLFRKKRDGAALRLFPFCPYFSCSSAASFRQQQKTSIACCSSSTGGRDGATRILLSFGSTP